jgi:cellobiose phosphorylase
MQADTNTAAVATLKQAWEAATARVKAEGTPEAFQAAIDAWAAYDASGKPRATASYASRAGKRQQADRRGRDRR